MVRAAACFRWAASLAGRCLSATLSLRRRRRWQRAVASRCRSLSVTLSLRRQRHWRRAAAFCWQAQVACLSTSCWRWAAWCRLLASSAMAFACAAAACQCCFIACSTRAHHSCSCGLTSEPGKEASAAEPQGDDSGGRCLPCLSDASATSRLLVKEALTTCSLPLTFEGGALVKKTLSCVSGLLAGSLLLLAYMNIVLVEEPLVGGA